MGLTEWCLDLLSTGEAIDRSQSNPAGDSPYTRVPIGGFNLGLLMHALFGIGRVLTPLYVKTLLQAAWMIS